MSRAVILSAVRTPVGRYGGALSGVRPDDLAAIAIAAAVERAGVPAGRDRGRPLRLRQPGRRGQPQRRTHGGAARGAARVRRRRDRQPPVRVGARRRRLRVSRRRRGRRRPVRGRRRRVDEPRAARDGQAGHGVAARKPGRLRHGARLALPEPADGGDVPARVDGRDGRERRRALERLARGPGRVRPRVAAALGGGERGGALRRRARRRSARSSATSTRVRTRPPSGWRS